MPSSRLPGASGPILHLWLGPLVPGDELGERLEVAFPPHPSDVVVPGPRDDHEVLVIRRELLVKRESVLEGNDFVPLAVDLEHGQTDRCEAVLLLWRRPLWFF